MTEGKEESKAEVKNGNVVGMLQKWYLGGTTAVSPTTISALAAGLSAGLSEWTLLAMLIANGWPGLFYVRVLIPSSLNGYWMFSFWTSKVKANYINYASKLVEFDASLINCSIDGIRRHLIFYYSLLVKECE